MAPSNIPQRPGARPLCLFLLSLVLALPPSCGAPSSSKGGQDIRAYGAKEGEDCTLALQQAIDHCAAQGGGRVIVPGGGTYLCRTIYLKDNVELHLEKDATLQGVPDADAYAACTAPASFTRYDSGNGSANANCASDPQWMKALIAGVRVHGAAITGEGTLDGAHVRNPLGEEGMRGPHLVVLCGAEHFSLRGVHLTRAGNYAVLGYEMDDARFEGLHITQGWDGIHIRGGKGILIRNCRLETGDDCVAGGYWEGFLMEKCLVNSSCNGLRMIMPSRGVTVRDCRFVGPGKYPHRTSGDKNRRNMLFGVCLEPGAWGRAEGETSGILLRNLDMEGMASPVATSVREGSTARDLRMENIRATRLTGALCPLVCWNDLGFDSVEIHNCHCSR